MKNKPIVMEHYHKVHTTYVVDFTFTTNITFLTGDSGQGRSVVFSFLEEDAVKNSQLLCFNYLDCSSDLARCSARPHGSVRSGTTEAMMAPHGCGRPPLSAACRSSSPRRTRYASSAVRCSGVVVAHVAASSPSRASPNLVSVLPTSATNTSP